MIDTDKYERMRLLFLDFIDTASDEVDEQAWKDKLTALDELLAEVKRLNAKLFEAELWVNNDSYTFENDVKELNDYLEAIE